MSRAPQHAPPTPNLDRQSEVLAQEGADLIARFVDWLFDERGFVLAVPDPALGWQDFPLRPARWSPAERRRVIETFFGMDPDAAEEERAAVLRHLQEVPR